MLERSVERLRQQQAGIERSHFDWAAVASESAVEPQAREAVDTLEPSEREFLSEYQRVAKKIGYDCIEARTKLGEADLLEFLNAECISIYDIAQVTAYMNHIIAEMNAQQCAFISHLYNWQWVSVRSGAKSNGFGATSYTKPIPYPVLCTMEKLVDRFGDQVEFHVTDIVQVPKPDPFLAVSIPGGQKFVIERWDEPKFRDKP